MGLSYREIEYNESSPFYSYLLRDVFFSNLSHFVHKSGNRNRIKSDLAGQIPSSSVQVTKSNDVFQGLPIPPRLKKDIPLLRNKHPHWILAYHDLDEPAVFILFPAGPGTNPEDIVRAERDLDGLRLLKTQLKPPLHSFHVDRCYVWLNTILIKSDQKIREGLVFDVPHIFLSREDVWVRDYKQISDHLDGEIAQDIVGGMIGAELPAAKFFDVFYDTTNAVLVYLRSSFHIGVRPRIPDVFYEPNGCEWKNRKNFMSTPKRLFHAGRTPSIREWLHDS